MHISQWLEILLFSTVASAQLPVRDYDVNDYFALQLHEHSDPEQVASILGARLEGPLGSLPDHYTFSCPKHAGDNLEDSLQELKRKRRKRATGDGASTYLDGVRWSQRQQLRKRHVKRIPPLPVEARQSPPPADGPKLSAEQEAASKKLDEIATTLNISDPIFKEQWHLFNYMQPGHDLNVTGVWLEGITGNGSVSAIVDDGLDLYSDDLKDNYFALGSWDFNDKVPEPQPRLSDDRHGTRCAGEIGAGRNNVCGVGMAYDSKIAGIRILSKPISDEDEALSINYKFQDNHIYSCSWGPPDDGQTMEAPGILIQRALVNGVQRGRDGRGSVFVFAAGNGAASDDNCNFDGYTNSIYSITVGGIDRAGNHPYYSESCSAQLVVTYSSGAGDAIHTTDVGTDKCSNIHGGTSAAGPLVVGAIALALSARPELTWRDLQYLVVNTAVPIHLDDGSWQDTKIGKKFSHMYGYGKMDTYAFIQAAKTFQLVKPQAWYHSPWLSVQHKIPEGDQGLASSFDVTKEMLDNSNLERLEHVTVTMNVEHTRRGDLSVELRSPEGVVSHIATDRKGDSVAAGYEDWTFMSVAHWGESGIGTWTIVVKDTHKNGLNGTFVDWRLNLWGESKNAAIQQLLPLPDEHDDDHETATVPVTTTSIDPGSSKTDLPAKPTDHIDRPINAKPSDEADTSTSTSISTPTATTPVPSSTAPAEASPTHTVSDSFLPDFFPTFGVSKRTQIWIYGSLGLIIVFCASLSAYFFIQRRKRLRNNPRDDYEFEMVHDDDMDEAKQGLTGRRGRNRRGGELYDAFAGESDEDVFSDEESKEGDDDDDDDDRYQDTPSTESGNGSAGEDKHDALRRP